MIDLVYWAATFALGCFVIGHIFKVNQMYDNTHIFRQL